MNIVSSTLNVSKARLSSKNGDTRPSFDIPVVTHTPAAESGNENQLEPYNQRF
ncbi:MAG: hypothetical protein HKN42_12870 [Granulosicoccus sp.]|nr:hypothetical protein [Granulosicoccus sp.]